MTNSVDFRFQSEAETEQLFVGHDRKWEPAGPTPSPPEAGRGHEEESQAQPVQLVQVQWVPT